ncbi:MAG: ribbon-helix-helix protein, CopG family [Planctomycetota bacterium]|jgi:hypothetical protein
MVRTQIQLTEAQAAQVKRAAALQHVSMAEVIRQSVDRYLQETLLEDQAERRERALGVAGRFRSGVSDLAKRHDDHLAQAFE